MKKSIFIIFACFLTGCSLFPEGKEPPPLYTLKNTSVIPASPLHASLAIELPRSEPSLDTYRIGVTLLPYSREYIENGQWPEYLPKTLLEYFMETFTERWGGTSINRAEDGLQTSYTLYSHIHDFSLYPSENGCTDIRLKISFRLVDFQTRRSIAGRIFSKTVRVPIYTMEGITAAFNQGLHELTGETTGWIEEVVRKEKHL